MRALWSISPHLERSFADKLGRISHYDRLGIDVRRDDRSRADQGRVSDLDARSDEYPRGDPAFTRDPNRSADERERHVAVIMRAGAKIGFLRYDGMRSDRYIRNGIERHVVADPDVVAHCQIPGISHAHARADENIFSDLRAK